jgi:hypothetical protein
VEDVKHEITKKRTEGKATFYHRTSAYKRGVAKFANHLMPPKYQEKSLSKVEKEKIIEVLMSQERVLTLLFDKTFPPKPQN